MKKYDYVFGETAVGAGYYLLCTREAYQLLVKKIARHGKIRGTKTKRTRHGKLLVFAKIHSCGNNASSSFGRKREECSNTSTLCVDSVQRHWSLRKSSQWCHSAAVTVGNDFPLYCVLPDEFDTEGCTLADVCNAAGCGGWVKAEYWHAVWNVISLISFGFIHFAVASRRSIVGGLERSDWPV